MEQLNNGAWRSTRAARTLSHPEARYFAAGRIGRDQIEDYARRKGMQRAIVERWLSPNLGYEPRD